MRIDARVCLGIGRPLKTPLDDIETERSETRDKNTKLLLLLRHEKKQKNDKYIDWFDCSLFNRSPSSM